MSSLLKQGDFHVFSFDKKKYVFLSGSQQILEISNPTTDAYFKRCAGRDDGNTLGDTTIDKVTETLKSLCTSTFRLLRKAKTRYADTERNAWLQHVLQILFCFDPARQKKRDAPFGSQKRNCQHA